MAKKINNDFYHDLDKQKSKIHFGCSSLIFFLIFLFVAGAYIIWWSIKEVKKQVYTPKVIVSQLALDNIEKKLQGFLTGDNKQGEPIKLIVSDQELTSLLVKSELLAGSENYAVTNPSAVIYPDRVEVFATLAKPMRSNISVSGTPYIDKGEIKFKVNQTKMGNLNLPQIVSGRISGLFEKLVTTRLNNQAVEYQSINLSSGIMTLNGIRSK